jgi:hypothetical protein
MGKTTGKDRKGMKRLADTAQAGGGAYAPHNQEAERLAEKATEKQTPTQNDGDERTPEKTIGEIKYAKQPDKKGGH